jgi:hypothetical protein
LESGRRDKLNILPYWYKIRVMKKYLLVFIALLLIAVAVTATVLNSNKKSSAKKETRKERTYKKSQCSRLSSVACY